MNQPFSLKTLAEYLHLSPRQVSRLIASGEIASVKRGHSLWILPEDVEAFLQKYRRPSVAERVEAVEVGMKKRGKK